VDLSLALPQNEIAVVEEIVRREPATVHALFDVVDVGSALLNSPTRFLLGLGETGALEKIDQGEVVEQF
jgi:hypothetical protein